MIGSRVNNPFNPWWLFFVFAADVQAAGFWWPIFTGLSVAYFRRLSTVHGRHLVAGVSFLKIIGRALNPRTARGGRTDPPP